MTTVQEIERLLKDYRAWLKDARSENGGYVLTDDSYTVHDLEASGCNLNTEKRRDLLKMTLNGFGVRMNGEAIEVHASTDTFPARKHNLIQAILAVNDLFYLAKPVVESLFFEDVVAWLDANDIRYTPKVKFPGVSGFEHLFDFVIPKSPRKQPERIVQAINRPTRDNTESFIHAWSDTREVRPPESKAYAILNDIEQSIQGGVLDAFRNYQIQAVPWSRRGEIAPELAA
jgi:hypothetical protein